MTFTYAECFAGAGGMSLGFERAGMTCRWHAEIAEFPRRVLARHWPDTLLSGGAPCQDLSVAGKRLGFKGERSVLYFELVRLWHETEAPYFLYENVAGALSSNAGADFAAVLSAIVGGAVPVPAQGWPRAGVVSGPTGVAAWRLLDAQWFGVPQRRLRVFVLGARAGGVDPAEVLLEPSGVSGNPPTRGETREGSASRARDGATDASGDLSFQPRYYTRDNKTGGAATTGPVDITNAHKAGDSAPHVLSFGWRNAAAQGDDVTQGSVAPLRTGTTPAVLAFAQNQRDEVREMAVCGALAADAGVKQQTYVVTVGGEGVRHALTHEGHDASEDGTGRRTPIVANAVCAREAKGWNPASSVGNGTVSNGIPRRLMPVECSRLMSWPDTWLDVPDEKGRMPSDAVKYKACGNGVVSNVAQWIGERLVACHAALREAAA